MTRSPWRRAQDAAPCPGTTPSKNDIPWGQFDASLDDLAECLASMPRGIPVHEAVHRAVLDFNQVPDTELGNHRQRMELLLRTPALQAHSALRYRQWRTVISEHVAHRYGMASDDLLPRTVGEVSLAVALSAYEQRLEEEGPVTPILDKALGRLRAYLSDSPADHGA